MKIFIKNTIKRIYPIFYLLAVSVMLLHACDIDNMDYGGDLSDVYIDSVVVKAANNNFIEEDIKAAVDNPFKTIVASLPNSAEGQQVALSIYTQEGMTVTPVSGSNFPTGESTLQLTGFGLEEEYAIDLKVLDPIQLDKEFVSKWIVESGEEITLPLIETGTYNFEVFWGDNQSGVVASYDLESASHTYQEAGEYTITIKGDIVGFNFNETDQSADNILDILDWGQLKLGNNEAYFRGCSNLQITAENAPDLSETTNLKAIFRECVSFNSNINHWDVSEVISMQDMFYKASNYNQPLGNWDVSNVNSFETMFRESSFNQDISMWDVSSATTMKNMFRDCPFNQSIGVWDVSNVTSFQSFLRGNRNFDKDLSGWGDKLGNVITMRELFRDSGYNGDLSAWDVSQVVSMWDMFKDSDFNNPSINNWDVYSLDNMETMFGEDSKFNQDISGWNVSSVVNMQNLFKNNQYFNQDLSGWEVNNVKCNENYDTGASQWQEQNKPNFTGLSSDDQYCDRPY